MSRNGETTIKLLRPDQVWQPAMGAPRGNRNAANPVLPLSILKRRIQGLKRRLRAALKDIGA